MNRAVVNMSAGPEASVLPEPLEDCLRMPMETKHTRGKKKEGGQSGCSNGGSAGSRKENNEPTGAPTSRPPLLPRRRLESGLIDTDWGRGGRAIVGQVRARTGELIGGRDSRDRTLLRRLFLGDASSLSLPLVLENSHLRDDGGESSFSSRVFSMKKRDAS